MRKRLSIILMAMLAYSICFTQSTDLIIRKNADKVEIPFEYRNNFIIIDVLLNDIFPLKFIFDTGAEHTILTKREITDLLQVNYQRRFTIMGSDMKTELYAYLATGVRFQINQLLATNRTMLVLDDDYFRFEEFAGINVQGILGADFFRRFIVKIDFKKRKITLYNPAKFEPPSKKFKEIPIEIHRHKPYVQGSTKLQDGLESDLKLLVDSGASLALLLHTKTDPNLKLPPQVIRSSLGMGLGGTIEGFMGRVQHFEMADYYFDNLGVNFQELLEGADSSYLNDRNGIVGNQILSRFTMIIDYVRSKLYLKPNRELKRKFSYDKSGLAIAGTGVNHNEFTVFYVVPGSPSDEAGIKVGDRIKSFNNIPASFLTLNDIVRKLHRKKGKTVKMKISRGEETFLVSFKLRDMI